MPDETIIHAFIEYDDPYVQPLLLLALQKHLPHIRLLPSAVSSQSSPSTQRDDRTADPASDTDPSTLLPTPTTPFLQWSAYERLAFPHLLAHPQTALANAFVIRKALIRKHFLSATVDAWRAKSAPSASASGSVSSPGRDPSMSTSALVACVPMTVHFEVDYAEFLDDALDEADAWDLKESWERGEGEGAQGREWWILKPGMSDRGQGIRLFSSKNELQAIFDEWEEGMPDPDDEDEDTAETRDEPGVNAKDGIMTSHLRHFTAQRYIHPPLLLPAPSPSAGRKFHIRVYVLAVGALRAYVYRDMLALFAADPYSPPWEDASELKRHLTNTCLQDGSREGSVRRFWDLEEDGVPLPLTAKPGQTWKDKVFNQICEVTSELFLAAARTQPIHFQPLPNAFEIFGLDFLVDTQATWLLEVNAFPDFRQTGDELSGLVKGLFEDVVQVAVVPFFDQQKKRDRDGTQRLVKVLEVDLGRSHSRHA